MSKFQTENNIPYSQNTPASVVDLGLGFLNPDMGGGDTRILYDVCALLLTILRPHPPSRRRMATGPPPSLTPAAIASVLMGASVALVLCGSVTFVIGMMMMPWVIGLMLFCYFMGIISSLKSLATVIICALSSPVSRTSPVEVTGFNFDKLWRMREAQDIFNTQEIRSNTNGS